MSQITKMPPISTPEPEESPEKGTMDARERSWFRRYIHEPQIGDRRVPVIRILVSVVLIGILIAVSPSFLLWGLMVGAAVIAVPFSRLHSVAMAFLPYAGAWLIFTVLRSTSDETLVPLRTESVNRVERDLFFGHIPTIWLQNLLFDPLQLTWYDYLTTFIHWSYFLVPHVVAIYLWIKHRELFTYYVLTTVLLLGIGLTIYFLAPAAPPWLTADTAPQEDIFRVMANVGRTINSDLYDRTYNVIGDSNPVAAMPSMHEAITFVIALFALRAGRWWAAAGVLYAFAMGFSLVYTGEHYVIDILVGCGLAVYSYVIAGRWLATMPPFVRVYRRRTRPLTQPISGASS